MSHSCIQVRKAVLLLQDVPDPHLLGEGILQAAPEYPDAPALRLAGELQHAHGPGGVHAVHGLGVEDDELHTPEGWHLVLLFLDELLLHTLDDGHAGAEEDIALQVHHHDPLRGDVHKALVPDLTHGAVPGRDLVPPVRPPRHGGHLRVLGNEGDGSQEHASEHREDELPGGDEHDDDDDNLQPLAQVQELSGAIHVVNDKACSREEEQRAEKQLGQVVEMFHGAEVTGCTQQRVHKSRPPVRGVAHHSVADDVELELHVSHGTPAKGQDKVEEPKLHCLRIAVRLQGQLGLGGMDLQDAIHGGDDDHHRQVRQSARPGGEVDALVGRDTIRPNPPKRLVADLWEEPSCIAHRRHRVATGINCPVEDRQRQQQAQGHHDGGVPNVQRLDKV
mmetsp:Transcript_110168/g.262562  ORF Transcript_110168/g.262562 Transcript_110168/m.262562 type:complete len:391 (+) Transcript_110168:2364-3536(+)